MLNRLLFASLVLPLGSIYAQDCVPRAKLQRTEPAPIRDISFSNDGLLDSERELEIVKLLRAETVQATSAAKEMQSLADEAAEPVRLAYQNQGYFKAKVTAEAVPSLADQSQYDIHINIGPVGKQYRLGELNIIKAAAFPTQQLRDLFPLDRGEIFSREKIADGLQELRTLYSSQGYINFTGVPDTQLDEDSAVVNLTIDVNEGKQFRLRSVKVLGLDPDTKSRLLDAVEMKPGNTFIPELWQRSLMKFPDLAQYPPPQGGSKLDEREGLLDMVLDFRKTGTCPAQGAPTP